MWMHDLLSSLPAEGVGWIALAAFMGGLARGFAGFGGALVFLPIAAQYIPPFWAITVLAFMELIGPIPSVPAKWKVADRPDLARLLIGAGLCLPLGLLVLQVLPAHVFQLAVCLVSFVMLAVMMAGLRLSAQMPARAVYAIGGAGGLLGGVTGQPGPPVIISYMMRGTPAQVVRANMSLFLLVYDVLAIAFVLLLGELAMVAVLLGLGMTVPNMAGNIVGSRLFDPRNERLFRWVAYGLIGGAAVSGLPIWG
jgi:uncharacterized membrane protein YfcA